MTEKFFHENPGARKAAEEARLELEKHTAEYEESGSRSGQTLVVPVVFHIVHAGGVENISEAQVQSAIEVLNEDFSASNPELGEVQPAFQGVIGDVNIEFRRARKDPNGACTNGVVRTLSSLTFDGGFSLLNVSPQWPRNRYLNVYVCAEIEGNTAGFTLIPSSVNGSQGSAVDAIYITHSYVGRVGTSNQQRSHTLSHEVGHWINLEHLWGPTNNPGVASNCNFDDGVGDTPNTIGWTSCNLTGESCGTLDNAENIMEYSSCSKHFTAGQASRMRAALNSSIAQRNQLTTNSNLTFTGVNLPDEVCFADFVISGGGGAVCPGNEVTFNDISYNGVTSRSWSFEGGQPATSTAQNPTVTFSEPGNYSVTLTVSNPLGELTVTKNEIITVVPEGEMAIPFYENFESFSEILHLQENWVVANPDGDMTRQWEMANSVGFSNNRSVRVRGRFNANGAEEHLETPTIDLSSVSENAEFTFKYAHARRNSNSNDRLVVSVSRNCGSLWNSFVTITMNDLPTVSGNVPGEFVPSGPGDWEEVSVPNIISIMLNPEFKARFEFTSLAGNNIYIDDINIFDPLTVSTDDEFSMADGIKIYPNPTADQFTFEYQIAVPGRVTAEVIDISGRTLDALFSTERAAGKYIATYDVSHLAPGVYFVRLTANDQGAVKKLIVR
ncbi:MAG: M43 family zinc metalloprotease [Cryomorphaceae bacterium]|nr:T9SS type A sorting domain-containing protein [Flavobacteriales bacterium]